MKPISALDKNIGRKKDFLFFCVGVKNGSLTSRDHLEPGVLVRICLMRLVEA